MNRNNFISFLPSWMHLIVLARTSSTISQRDQGRHWFCSWSLGKDTFSFITEYSVICEFFPFFFLGGMMSHQVLLSFYSWLCAQGSLLAVLRVWGDWVQRTKLGLRGQKDSTRNRILALHMVVWGSNPSIPHGSWTYQEWSLSTKLEISLEHS